MIFTGMASIQCLNPKAELARHAAALELNVSGAKGLQEVMKSNLGPKGTLKMLVHFEIQMCVIKIVCDSIFKYFNKTGVQARLWLW